MSVTASVDGRHFGRGDGGPTLIVFDGRLPPLARQVVPAWITAEGGPIIVIGTNLAPTPDLACVFDQVGSVAATVINATAVRCLAPRASPQPTQLRLTLDGSLLSPTPLDFIFHDWRYAQASANAQSLHTPRPPRALLPIPHSIAESLALYE